MELKELNVSTQLVIEEPTPPSQSQKKKKKISRRPELDVIIVALTWGILLWHVCLLYFRQYAGPGKLKPIKEDAYTIISSIHIVWMFIDFMDVWNMPMFFYLSGNREYFIKCQIFKILFT